MALKPTSTEKQVLETFFRTAGSTTGGWDKANSKLNQAARLFQPNLAKLRTLLKNGVNPQALQKACRMAQKNKLNYTFIDQVAPELLEEARDDSLDRNLLDASKPYVHRLLSGNKIPITSLGYGSTHSEVTQQPTVISAPETFTMRELIQFWCDRTGNHYTSIRAKGWMGAFTYLLTNYGLDNVLIAIDIIADRPDLPVGTPLDISKAMPEAEDELSNRRARRDYTSA